MAANGLGWLLYASDLGGEHQGGRGMKVAAIDEKCLWHAFLLVFSVQFYMDANTLGGSHWWKVFVACIFVVFGVLFYMDANALIAENRLRCNIYDNVM